MTGTRFGMTELSRERSHHDRWDLNETSRALGASARRPEGVGKPRRATPSICTPTGRRPSYASHRAGRVTHRRLHRSQWLRDALGETATWRPLSERGVDQLTAALNTSPLDRALGGWSAQLGVTGRNPFHRSGFNRARHAQLVWQAVTDLEARHHVEAIAVVDLPAPYATVAATPAFTLDVIVRIRAFLVGAGALLAGAGWRLTVPDLFGILGALLATLTARRWPPTLADLAAIDPVLVPPSRETSSSRPGLRLGLTAKLFRFS